MRKIVQYFKRHGGLHLYALCDDGTTFRLFEAPADQSDGYEWPPDEWVPATFPPIPQPSEDSAEAALRKMKAAAMGLL